MQPVPTTSPQIFNPALVVVYDDVLSFVKHRLTAFAHGVLKPWANDQGLNYSMIVNLKNDRIYKQTPLLLQRLLKTFGFEASPLRLSSRQEPAYVFLFDNVRTLAAFRQQLSFLNSMTATISATN